MINARKATTVAQSVIAFASHAEGLVFELVSVSR